LNSKQKEAWPRLHFVTTGFNPLQSRIAGFALCRIKIRHYNIYPSLRLCNPCSLEAINAASS